MNKHFIPHLLVGAFLLFVISCGVSEIKESAAVKTPAPPKPGDCASCHEGKKVLPDDHVDTKDMTGDDCSACHEPESNTLRTKIPLSHIHKLAGISCTGCHEDPASAVPADTAVCQKCHSDSRSLVEAASKLKINPHFSPHEGKTPDCKKCHHMHKSSENYCAQCHGLKYDVP